MLSVLGHMSHVLVIKDRELEGLVFLIWCIVVLGCLYTLQYNVFPVTSVHFICQILTFEAVNALLCMCMVAQNCVCGT